MNPYSKKWIVVFLLFLLQELLTKHKMLAADFLEANFERVFSGHYQKLLHSDNYVTRRQSLKLLGELLLDRHNFSVSLIYCDIVRSYRKSNFLRYYSSFNKHLADCYSLIVIFQVMTRYISNPDNLKLMMNMLKEKSRNIQFEAFHVFKVK